MNKQQWHAASYGSGPRHWYVIRDQEKREVLSDNSGRYRRYGSFESANRAADKENAK